MKAYSKPVLLLSVIILSNIAVKARRVCARQLALHVEAAAWWRTSGPIKVPVWPSCNVTDQVCTNLPSTHTSRTLLHQDTLHCRLKLSDKLEVRMKDVAAYTILLSITLLLLCVHDVSSFEYSSYCQKMCMWGRGGNLCKCNAVHFAGKRGISEAMLSDTATQTPDVLLSSNDASDTQFHYWLPDPAVSSHDLPSYPTASEFLRAKQ